MSKKPGPVSYAGIAVALGAAGVALVLFFAWFTQTQLPQGIQLREYYLMLVVWGCLCAIILFGVVRGVARVTHSSLGWTVELGGPVAVAALVVWGGAKVGTSPEERSITVRPFAVDSSVALLTQGTVTLESGDVRYPPEILSERGEARFGGLAVGRVMDSVKVLVRAPGYVERWLALPVRRGVVEVPMERVPPTMVVRGRFSPPPRGSRATIELDDNRGEAVVDSSGRFTLTARGQRGESVGLRVIVGGRVVLDRFALLDTVMSLTATGQRGAR